MNQPIDIDRFKHELALEKWSADCRHRMALRYPKIPFDADVWPLRTLYATDAPDYRFTEPMADFAGKHTSFADALRCLVAEIALAEKVKGIVQVIMGFRLLRWVQADSLFDLDHASLRSIETTELLRARSRQYSALLISSNLSLLGQVVDKLAAKGVLPRLRYTVKQETRSELQALRRFHLKQWRQSKADVLDRQIEALNEAFNALFANDPRLSAGDRVAIATMGLELCAPSRINEILCLSIDDHVSIDDYARRAVDKGLDKLHAAHQMLIVTMKGSKGAQWSAKPVLNFMIELFHYCLKVIKAHGERSRMLVQWYQQNPDRLYLPPELEYLRGTDLSVRDLAKIMYLTEQVQRINEKTSGAMFTKLGAKRFKAPNPNPINKDGTRASRHEIDVIRWDDIEPLMLANVRTALAGCAKVTVQNHYKGDLAKMLFLFDTDESAYLPGAANYAVITSRLKQTAAHRKVTMPPTLFEKLGITMPVKGHIQTAEINTHDPRRWLTTMALTHGEKLSNVLVNKWANRLSIAQLWNYDFRSPETKAKLSAMPEAPELKELSNGLTSCRKLEDEYGLRMDIVTVQDAGVSATTMEAVCAATENRPIAKTAEQVLILYANWYGICVHQHHETPCRAYTSCLPCNNNHAVKGHIPTNDRIRERADLLHRSILNQLEQLVIVQNRGIADDPDALVQHVLALAERGLDPAQMADEMIARFHEIKHMIKDTVFKNHLHEAFVATRFVQNLDNPEVTSGALMKYHNPTHHAAPGLERALDAYGGHEQIERDRLAMIEKFPQFAPQALGLKDQRSLIAPDDDDSEDDAND